MALESFLRRPWRRPSLVLPLVLLVGLSAAFVSRAGEDEEDEVIHRAIEAGEIAPLQALFTEIRREYQGRILKVELEQEWHGEDPLWVYEAKILTPRGHVLELEYDARSLELIEIEGRHDGDD
jgi:uncharacterized membrane protein YkoI